MNAHVIYESETSSSKKTIANCKINFCFKQKVKLEGRGL